MWLSCRKYSLLLNGFHSLLQPQPVPIPALFWPCSWFLIPALTPGSGPRSDHRCFNHQAWSPTSQFLTVWADYLILCHAPAVEMETPGMSITEMTELVHSLWGQIAQLHLENPSLRPEILLVPLTSVEPAMVPLEPSPKVPLPERFDGNPQKFLISTAFCSWWILQYIPMIRPRWGLLPVYWPEKPWTRPRSSWNSKPYSQ